MGFLRGPDYLALPRDEHPWLVKGLIPARGSVNVFGKAKTGKSMAVLQLSAALSSGAKDWLGFPILSKGPVAYIQVDTPRGIWQERVRDLIKRAGYDFSNVYFTDGQDAPYPFDIMSNGYEWMQTELNQLPERPAMVVWDTFRDIHSGEEDDSTTVRNVLTQIRACVGWDSAILIVSHARKGGGAWTQAQGGHFEPDIRDENRGSGAMAGAVDSLVWFREKKLVAIGRALEEVHVGIKQDPERAYAVELADAFVQDALRILSGAPATTALRTLAGQLHAQYPKKSLEACRSALRRLAPEARHD
jgi:KaiC/GvpD/RAD55 family RecA-like ATPase